MFVPGSFVQALVMMVVSMICWGSWANTYKGTKGYRFELFYWDYAFGIFLIALALALTLGSWHHNETSFLVNLRGADNANLWLAVVAGIIFNVANLLLVAGIDIAGLAVAFPVSIGIALVVGVFLSYAVQRRGNLMMLAIGVAAAVAAVIMDGKAYGSLGTQGHRASRKGIVVCVVSGLLMGSFAPFVARAMSAGKALGPYGVAVLFTAGALLCCCFVNVYFMKRPLVGEPVQFSKFVSAALRDHALGLLGGAVWGLGTVFNFVAAHFTGVAISYAIGQAAPMVAALWGIFVWKEFAGARAKSKRYLILMFVFYVAAVTLVASA